MEPDELGALVVVAGMALAVALNVWGRRPMCLWCGRRMFWARRHRCPRPARKL